jgi:hypothetical protein
MKRLSARNLHGYPQACRIDTRSTGRWLARSIYLAELQHADAFRSIHVGVRQKHARQTFDARNLGNGHCQATLKMGRFQNKTAIVHGIVVAL